MIKSPFGTLVYEHAPHGLGFGTNADKPKLYTLAALVSKNIQTGKSLLI